MFFRIRRSRYGDRRRFDGGSLDLQMTDQPSLFSHGPESDDDFRSRVLQTMKDDGRWRTWPATFADIKAASGYNLDRLAAHLELERKSNV
jgi:hypothetical protein